MLTFDTDCGTRYYGIRSATSPFVPAKGVKVTGPATSANSALVPAVAAGTRRVTVTVVEPRAGTRTSDRLSDTVCGLPAGRSVPTVNVTAVEPKLRTWTFRVWR